MTKKKAVQLFVENNMPGILEIEKNQPKGSGRDLPLRQQSWCNFIDYLQKGGEITASQANRWGHPAICN